MPSGLKQPIGQKRLTNIAVVRFRKAGAVFEVACYKNKVVNWRAEIETDLDEVLQTTAIFSNVSKGIMAKEAQLQKVFNTTDEKKVCLEILAKGELQVSEKERKLDYDNLYKDVSSILAEKCVDPNTNRQYTATIIERALKDVHFNPDLKKSAKQQAFSEALPLLQERFSIQRANMRIQLNIQRKDEQAIHTMIKEEDIILESSSSQGTSHPILFICLIEPGQYRALHKKIEELTQGTGRLELLNLSVSSETKSTSTSSSTRETIAKEESSRSEQEEDVREKETKTSHGIKKKLEEDNCVVYPRGKISDLPEDFNRKEMFLEIDKLETGWEMQLTQKQGSEIIDAVFFAPSGERIGRFSKARQKAMVNFKSQQS